MKDKKMYQQYPSGTPIQDAFNNDLIPLMTMENLRELDFQISRNISYERTVDEFLTQLAVNDSLRILKNRTEMVILLNEEGALRSENGVWTLFFTPGSHEHYTLDPHSDLYEVLKELKSKYKKGEICSVRVPDRSMKTLVSDTSPFSILDEYCKKQPGQYLRVAEKIVTDGPEELYRHVPICRFNKLQTVDKNEIENYSTIKALLDDYILQYEQMIQEETIQGETIQPLSIAVFGYPGSGKSFGVKQIAATSDRFAVASINLSQYEDPQQFFEAFDEALTTDPEKIPLIFLDEFDAELNGISRGWLKYFLAPMQDGEYTMKGKVRHIDKAVFVFAGGTVNSFADFLPCEDEESLAAFAKVKGPDFVSRLKGILNIKGLNPATEMDRSYIIRRAMFLRQNILRNAPSIYDQDTGTVNISRSLLSSLLRVSEYRHGARSLEFILAMCRLSGVHRFTPSCLPLDEQLDLHLDVEDFQHKLFFEQIMGEMVETYARTAHERYCRLHLEEEKLRLADDEAGLKQIALEPEMADWKELDEFYKEGYRSRIRYIGEYLVSYQTDIGIRPIVSNSPDAIRELYGPDLEELSEVEHKRWMKDKLEDGWKAGAKNVELKNSPELVSYQELTEESRDFIRREVREMPALLSEIGYELYHKAL